MPLLSRNQSWCFADYDTYYVSACLQLGKVFVTTDSYINENPIKIRLRAYNTKGT